MLAILSSDQEVMQIFFTNYGLGENKIRSGDGKEKHACAPFCCSRCLLSVLGGTVART